ncbi:hypothetical protein DNTS_011421 [Danionella cerebrum]|uniref:Uncharacterized protein n=1 Tax=Danionella cerebrum TaxID=2873325 RepID=A0A553R349_9TELE|nr:hypothetical protein DNTS_011421 [Danionella translucida]
MSTVRLRAGKHRSFVFPLGCSRLVTASVWDYSWVAVGTARICSRTLSIGAGFSRTSETPSVCVCHRQLPVPFRRLDPASTLFKSLVLISNPGDAFSRPGSRREDST